MSERVSDDDLDDLQRDGCHCDTCLAIRELQQSRKRIAELSRQFAEATRERDLLATCLEGITDTGICIPDGGRVFYDWENENWISTGDKPATFGHQTALDAIRAAMQKGE